MDELLICVLKTLKTYRTAQIIDKERKQFRKSSQTKFLHYYFYYLDKEFGFMLIKSQTWFPFKIQVYINSKELTKHVLDANSISFQCYENFFTNINDVVKAQELPN